MLPAKPLCGSSLRLETVVACGQNVQEAVIHLHLVFDSFVSLAREDVKAYGDGFFEDDLPVDVVPANRHAAAIAHGLELVRVVCPDYVGIAAMGSRQDHA